MPQKNIVVYFRKKIAGPDPFATWGKKRSVYHALFQKGIERGFAMYFIPQPEYYLGGYSFQNPWRYSLETKMFLPTKGIITADAIYDRSGGLSFPDKNIDAKVLNPWDFKALCGDKNATYALLKKFMPQNFSVTNQKEFSVAMQNFSDEPLVVFKPADSFGGNGVLIDSPQAILNSAVIKKGASYSLQSFVDTATGIPGVIEGHHDLRIIIVEGKVVMSHVRTPKAGSYLANVAQGGTIQEVPLTKIPSSVLDVVHEIQDILDPRFNLPVYSIDFGVSHGQPYVFELNDQIGFPSEDMLGANMFIDRLLLSLERLTQI